LKLDLKFKRMKTVKHIMMALALVAVLTSCRDKAAEKRIAELESRLSQLEGGGKSTSGVTPAPIPTVEPADQKPEGPMPVLVFENMEHDFGNIKEGQKVSYTYKFKNTGAAPLIIQNAQPSCGCTAPDWTREPIPVGGTGFVKAEFDSKGKPGVQNKTITVTSNTFPKTAQLKFKATVAPAAETSGPLK
jgi:Protein of unknown function (DUF1573)